MIQCTCVSYSSHVCIMGKPIYNLCDVVHSFGVCMYENPIPLNNITLVG